MKQIAALLFLLIPVHAFSQDAHYSIDTLQVKSQILNEVRSIVIFRPQHISKTGSVKFLYLPDGEYASYRIQKLREHFKDSLSDYIGIGIINTDRRRDLLYVNGADKFLDFTTTELMPIVEKGNIVKTRILFGHSFAGSFAVYSLIRKPGLFDMYIASSPTPIMDLIGKDKYLQIDGTSHKRIILYHSYGSDDMRQVQKWSKKLNGNISAITFKHLHYRFAILEGKNHNNSDIPALLGALKGY